MMSRDKLKYDVTQQFLSRDNFVLSCDIAFMLRQRLHYTISVKQTAKDAFSVLLPVKYCDMLQNFATFIWYIIKHLFHENLCSITF